MSISGEALDEIEAAPFRKCGVVYGSKVGDVLRGYLFRYREWDHRRALDGLITDRPGSDEQLAALRAYETRWGEYAINWGTEQMMDELNIAFLLSMCSPLQRKRFAWSWTYWRNFTSQ